MEDADSMREKTDKSFFSRMTRNSTFRRIFSRTRDFIHLPLRKIQHVLLKRKNNLYRKVSSEISIDIFSIENPLCQLAKNGDPIYDLIVRLPV